jgi:hypothetical protein
MTYPMMQHIPLKTAYLCQDCNCIGNCSAQCPACASSVLMSLSAVLDREASSLDRQASGEDKLALAYSFPKTAVSAAGDPFTAMVA